LGVSESDGHLRRARRLLLLAASSLLFQTSLARSATAEEPDASSGGPIGDVGILREADIILQASRSLQSRAIQLATRSRFSHMGLVHWEKGRAFVYEAVGPVKQTPLAEWVARGEGGHFVALRLWDADQRFTPDARRRIAQVESRFRGRP
jgi:hypothetical protein